MEIKFDFLLFLSGGEFPDAFNLEGLYFLEKWSLSKSQCENVLNRNYQYPLLIK